MSEKKQQEEELSNPEIASVGSLLTNHLLGHNDTDMDLTIEGLEGVHHVDIGLLSEKLEDPEFAARFHRFVAAVVNISISIETTDLTPEDQDLIDEITAEDEDEDEE